ncbi:MAG: hypothetical protein NT061_05005 [Spirochaetes bacterium]|nr:hypothetical protein [Spirochaetota bacterium]
MTLNKFFGGDRQEIPVYHAKAVEKHFAYRHCVDFKRESASRPDSALYRFGKLAEMNVAGIRFCPGINDDDKRFFDILVGIDSQGSG